MPFQLVFADDEAGCEVSDRDARKIRGVFVLEVVMSGDARRAACRRVGPDPYSKSPRKVGIVAVSYRNPCLKVAGTGLQAQKRTWPDPLDRLSREIVQLNMLNVVGRRGAG